VLSAVRPPRCRRVQTPARTICPAASWVCDKSKIATGHTLVPGDVAIGLRSSGLHTNGYSWPGKSSPKQAGKKYSDMFEPANKTFARCCSRRSAYSPVLSLMDKGIIKGCAHITGRRFPGHVDRILPPTCDVTVDTRTWTPDPIYRYMQRAGNVVSTKCTTPSTWASAWCWWWILRMLTLF